MTKKKTPAATTVTTSAPDSAIVAEQPGTGNHLTDAMAFTPRQARALDLLKPGRWVTREQLDRDAGAINSPDLIQQLRRKLGHDAIETQHFGALDRDGKPCRPGRYRLTKKGRELLANWREVAA